MPYSAPVSGSALLAPSPRLRERSGSAPPKRARRTQGRRYTAVLLFEFNVTSRGRSLARRLCEERVIVLSCSHSESGSRACQGLRAG